MPNALYLADLATATAETVKSQPPRFDAAELVSEQFEAVSTDGTAVPYFVVRPKIVAARRHGADAALWLWRVRGVADPGLFRRARQVVARKGGVYAVANIRGGGEFGPAWHQAALKRDRQGFRGFRRRGGGCDPPQDHRPAPPRHPWAARMAGC